MKTPSLPFSPSWIDWSRRFRTSISHHWSGPRIRSGFRLGHLRPLTDVFVLHEVEPSVINTDIRFFLESGLCELAKRQRIEKDGWPVEKYLDLLCERAVDLFVYAVVTLKFLDHSLTPPNEQLDIILKAPESTIQEGRTDLQPGTTLDSLYLSSFQSAFNRTSSEDDEKFAWLSAQLSWLQTPSHLP